MTDLDNVSMRAQVRYPRKLCEGWLEHKTHRANGSTYTSYWLVLKGDILYIFKSRETTDAENLIGSLTIDSATQFKPDGGDAKSGYKFDLNTHQRRNRFKSKKLSERELWRGYIMGVATNKVPDDLDLLESQVETIRVDVRAYKTGQPIGPENRVSMISGDSGDSGVEGSLMSGFSDRRTIPESRTSSGSRGSGGSGGSGGGPTMVHKFYRDMASNQSPPSWFFSGCSREKAQEILTQHSDYGNTLMRESTSHMQSGSYVISKRAWDKDENTYVFEHFEVMRVAGGYKLNVQNEHAPMRCLSDVMEYFKETSGSSTRLMDTNDPYRVGMPKNPESLYDKFLVKRMEPEPEPWTWPPPDYEDPLEPMTTQQRYPGGGANTVTPGILKNSKSPGARKSVDFYRNTYGGGKDRPYPKTTMDEIVDLSNTAASLRHFDDMIDGFETGNIYVNDDPMTNPDLDRVSVRSVPREQMPLPPTPHNPASHSYVNEANTFLNNAHDNHDVIKSLPVAPPPPRVQSALNNSANQNTFKEVKSLTKVPKSPPRTAPKPSSIQPSIGQSAAVSRAQSTKQSQSSTQKLNHTNTSPDMLSDITQRRAQLKKTMSEGSGLGTKINARSPESMPTWDNKSRPQSGVLQNLNDVSVSQKDNRLHRNEQLTSGVDDSNPGGVHNLSKMFEKSAQVTKSGQTTREKTPQRPGPLQAVRTPSVDRPDESKQTGIEKGLNEMDNKEKITSPSVESLSRRRLTDPGPLLHKTQGFNASFKRKLEGVLSVPKSPGSPTKVDHEYEELPIKPDAVTYANDIDY